MKKQLLNRLQSRIMSTNKRKRDEDYSTNAFSEKSRKRTEKMTPTEKSVKDAKDRDRNIKYYWRKAVAKTPEWLEATNERKKEIEQEYVDKRWFQR